MIKLKLNKYKIISLIKTTETIKEILSTEYFQHKLSLKRAEIVAHTYIIQGLSRKLRSKYISVEHKPEYQNFFFTVDNMQAYVLMLYYYPNLSQDITPFDLSVMGEILNPCFKKLLN